MIPMKQHADVSSALNELSGTVVDCFFQVHKELGPGDPEQIYEDALSVEISSRNILFQKQKTFEILYKGQILPTAFRPDMIIEQRIIVELKAVEGINPVHQSQIYAYLKATGLPLGFLVNFNVPLIKDGIGRYMNKNSASPDLRVKNNESKQCAE
jgi:GxxExxY protein